MMYSFKLVSAIAVFLYLSNTVYSQGNTCADATVISVPFEMNGMSTCGTGNDYSVEEALNPNACAGQNQYLGGGEDAVFAYTPTVDGCLETSIVAANAALHIFDGCPDDPLTASCIGFVYASSTGFGAATFEGLSVQVTANQTYYLVMSTASGCNGDFDLDLVSLTPSTLVNDFCENAIPLSNSGTNYGATNCSEPDSWTPGSCSPFGVTGWYTNENGVWFTFSVDASTPQPITLEIENVVCDDTGGSQMQMGIWQNDGTCTLSSATFIECDIGITTVGVSNMTLPLGDYYVFVDGSEGANCEWSFVSEEIVPPETDCVDNPIFIKN